MLLKKEYIFMIITIPLLLSIYSYFLLNKIDFFYIIVITLATWTVLKSIYDIWHKTGNQRVYNSSKKVNQRLRWIVFFMSLIMLSFVIKVTFNKVNSFKNSETLKTIPLSQFPILEEMKKQEEILKNLGTKESWEKEILENPNHSNTHK